MAKSNKLTVKEAAAYCGVTAQYLYQCRTNGKGPHGFRVYVHGAGSGPSERVFYSKRDLDAWNSARPVKHKSKKPTKRAA